MGLIYLLPLFLLLNAPFADASETYSNYIKSCGQYLISGIIKKDPDHVLVLIVNEKSKSEYRLIPNSGELDKFAGQIETPITLVAKVIGLNGHSGVVSNPSRIRPRIPNPLSRDQDTGVKLIKVTQCTK
jgi:hypothetical protein